MVVEVEVDLHRPAIYALLQNRVSRIGDKVRNVARRRVPSDTYRLARSLHVIVGSAPGFVWADIGTNVYYGLWRHEGTGIYGRGTPIVPVRAKVLRFRPGKRGASFREKARHHASPFVYRNSVRGTPGSPFLTSALRDVVGSAGTVRSFSKRG